MENKTKDKWLEGILLVLASFILPYLLVSFFCLSINFVSWGAGERGLVLAGWCLSLTATLTHLAMKYES